MKIDLVFAACAVLLTIALLVLISYVIMILSSIRKMLKPIDRVVNELSGEFKPLMNDFSGITSSLRNIAGRFDIVTRFVFGKAELVSKGADVASGFAQKFIKDPKGEFQALAAGFKKGLEIIFNRKGE